MTKQETIAYLKELNNALKKQKSLSIDYNHAKNKLNNVENAKILSQDELNAINKLDIVPTLIFIMIVALLIGIGLALIFYAAAWVLTFGWTLTADSDEGVRKIAYIIVGIILVIGVFISAITYFDNKGNVKRTYQQAIKNNETTKREKNNITQYRNRLSDIKNSLDKHNQYVNQLLSKNVIHENYCTTYCLDELIELLERGRADSLKEAINLYHIEEREYQRDQDNKEFQKKQLAIENQRLAEAQRAADAQQRLADAEEENARALANINRIESWKEFEEDIGLRKK